MNDDNVVVAAPAAAWLRLAHDSECLIWHTFTGKLVTVLVILKTGFAPG